MEQERFLAKLQALMERAEAQGQVLEREEIARELPDLSEDQFGLVVSYLAEHQVRIRGIAFAPKEKDEEAAGEELRQAMEELAEESPYFAAYYEEMKRLPSLSEEEEDVLFAKAGAGDEKARDLLLKTQLPLVAETALLYRDQGTRLDDLIQEGSLGLILGLETAIAEEADDWRRCVSEVILETLENAVYEDNAQVSVSRKSVEQAQSIREAAKEFGTEFGREPTKEQLAEYLEMDAEVLADILKLGSDEKDFLSAGEEEEERNEQ